MPAEPSGAASPGEPVRVCFVCLGNICRSPTAEAVMLDLVAAAGLSDRIEVDSAGTGAWHVGDPPDARAAAEARRRGLTMSSRGRQVQRWDLDEFDLLVAMDASNEANLRDLATSPEHHDRIVLLRRFDAEAGDDLDVPDPYYGGDDGFARVYDIVERSCRALLDHLVAELAAGHDGTGPAAAPGPRPGMTTSDGTVGRRP